MGQGSETQLQVCENLNYLIQQFKGGILLLLVTMNKFSTIFAVQNKFVGLLLLVMYWSIFSLSTRQTFELVFHTNVCR